MSVLGMLFLFCSDKKNKLKINCKNPEKVFDKCGSHAYNGIYILYEKQHRTQYLVDILLIFC